MWTADRRTAVGTITQGRMLCMGSLFTGKQTQHAQRYSKRRLHSSSLFTGAETEEGAAIDFVPGA